MGEEGERCEGKGKEGGKTCWRIEEKGRKTREERGEKKEEIRTKTEGYRGRKKEVKKGRGDEGGRIKDKKQRMG